MKHREVHEMIWKTFDFKEGDHPVPWGSSARRKRELIPILFASLNFNKGAEIGVQRGKFSQQLLNANPNLHLLCIDAWMPGGGRYTQELQDSIYAECLKRLANHNVTIIRKTSMEAVNDVPLESLDFVYIDANHHFDFAMEDILYWSKRVRSGGIVACHDYNHGSNSEVVFAVNAYTAAHHIDPWYVTKQASPTAYWVKP